MNENYLEVELLWWWELRRLVHKQVCANVVPPFCHRTRQHLGKACLTLFTDTFQGCLMYHKPGGLSEGSPQVLKLLIEQILKNVN